jgi:hypothetical protein
MTVMTLSVLAVLGLFFGILAMLEWGFRLGRRRARRLGTGSDKGLAAVDGAVFGLFGLLVAFTFSGAAQRFDERRQLIVEEANAIGTSWLRLDLLPEARAAALRPLYRDYLDARIAAWAHVRDGRPDATAMARAQGLQQAIWQGLVDSRQTLTPPTALPPILDAANTMFDISTTRSAMATRHPPTIIYALLAVAALLASLLAGMGMGYGSRRPWLQFLVFSGVVSLSVYVILDLEHPRIGLVRVDAADTPLIELRAQMGE